jgi:hypothetical protein
MSVRTSEPVYKIALAALNEGMVPVMVPGVIDADRAAVHIHGFQVRHFPVTVFGTDVERVTTLISMAYVARRFAEQAGMRLTGGPA